MSYSYTEANLIKLGHLKKLAQRAHGDITELAGLVLGTIEDMILQADISIPTSAWAANTDAAPLAEGYIYKADVSVTGLIDNANVNVTLSVPSRAIAAAAKMSATAAVSAGSVRFYAKSVPTANLTGKLDAIQLDDSE